MTAIETANSCSFSTSMASTDGAAKASILGVNESRSGISLQEEKWNINSLPAEAIQAMDKIYGGDPEAATLIARTLQRKRPDHPLGYLLEGQARWWKVYCDACEIKDGMVEAWKRNKESDDDGFLELDDKVISTAEAQLAKSDTAEMHVYAGIGWNLKARLYLLRGESRNLARASLYSRAHAIRALELDPQMADATTLLGLYNYYVDALSPFVKMLRVLVGIPGGDKATGLKQMETGMNQGVFLAVDIRFVLARLLRQYDQKYEQALSDVEPLVKRYPNNPLFLLLAGNLNAELGRNAVASEYFHSALQSDVHDSACATRVRDIANSFLASIH
jgi:tetratricopeptide (TPR) repeat protein